MIRNTKKKTTFTVRSTKRYLSLVSVLHITAERTESLLEGALHLDRRSYLHSSFTGIAESQIQDYRILNLLQHLDLIKGWSYHTFKLILDILFLVFSR